MADLKTASGLLSHSIFCRFGKWNKKPEALLMWRGYLILMLFYRSCQFFRVTGSLKNNRRMRDLFLKRSETA